MKLLVYYVQVGRLPKKKAQEYLHEALENFKKNVMLNLNCQIVAVPVREEATHFEVFDLS